MKQYKNRKNSSYEDLMEGGDNNQASDGVPGDAVQFRPIEIKVFGNNFDKAFKAFRSLVQKERILSTYKEKQFFEKPSDKKRRKRKEAFKKSFEE